MDSIDLGRKSPETEAAPATLAMSAEKSKSKPTVHYPTLYLDLDSDDLKKLPDSGTMTIKYKINRRTITASAKGDKSSSVSMDILKIVDAEGSKEKSASDTLDDLAQQVMNDEDGDDE